MGGVGGGEGSASSRCIKEEQKCDLVKVQYKPRECINFWGENGEKTDIDILKKAILSAEENVFGLKVFYREYEDGRNGIIFQFSSLFASNDELNKHFSRCLSILDKGIAFHREKYDEYHDSAQKELSGMTCTEHPEHRNLS